MHESPQAMLVVNAVCTDYIRWPRQLHQTTYLWLHQTTAKS